jgi:DNA-directed RNA polymerase specialized sigma24 family protein
VFSLAPEDFLLAYLYRFAVRVPINLLRGFSRQRGVYDFVSLAALASAPQDNDPPDFPSGSPYRPQPGALRPSPGSYSLLRPPIVITIYR